MTGSAPTVTAGIVDGFEAFLAKCCVSLDQVCQQAALRRQSLIPDDNNELPFQVVTRVLEAAAHLTRRPCFGLEWADAFPLGGAGTFGYLLVNAQTLEDAIRVAARYVPLVMHPVRCNLEFEGTLASLTWHLPAALQAQATQYIYFAAGLTILRLRRVAGPDWQPTSVELPCKKPCCGDFVHRLLGDQVIYAQPHLRLTIAKEDLSRRNQVADPRLFELMSELSNRMLKEQAAVSDLAFNVRRAIAGRLGKEEITLHSIGRALKLSPRTLQSRLAAQHTTFENILQTTRRENAEALLRDTNLPMSDIAFALGFSEQSAFTRACMRWFHAPPRSVRQSLKAASGDARGR